MLGMPEAAAATAMLCRLIKCAIFAPLSEPRLALRTRKTL